MMLVINDVCQPVSTQRRYNVVLTSCAGWDVYDLKKYIFESFQLITCRECDGAGGKNMEHLFRQCLVLSR